MATLILVAIWLTGLLSTNAYSESSAVDYSGYSVVKITISSEKDSTSLIKIKRELKIELWNDPNPIVGFSLALIPPELKQKAETEFNLAELKWQTVIPDFQKEIEKEREENRLAKRAYASFRPTIRDYNYAHYGNLKEVNKFMEDAAVEYPHLAESLSIGTSYENRSIYGLRISAATPGTRPAVVVECGIHPREWVSTATGIYIIGELLRNFTFDPVITKLVSDIEWYILPSVNPDGYHFTQTKDRNWRKTLAPSSVSRRCIGADVNRNFDANFCDSGSSRIACEEDYCGDYAFSEKESRALRDFSKTLGSRLKMYFSLHSFGQLWMYPYAFTKDQAPNVEELDSIAKIGAAALKAVNAKTYTVGQISKIIYEASGSSVDWVYDNVGTRLAYALELRDRGVFGFMLPPGQILPAAREAWAGIKAAVLAANL